LGWQTWLASTCFLAAEAFQGLIALNVPTYTVKSWQTTLLVIAVVSFSTLFNTVLASWLPLIEGCLLVLHVAGLLAVIIPLWVMGPRAEPHDVIFGWANDGGWGKGVSAMIGLPFMFGILYVSPCSDLASTFSAVLISDVNRVSIAASISSRKFKMRRLPSLLPSSGACGQTAS
jgi:choline transport protein